MGRGLRGLAQFLVSGVVCWGMLRWFGVGHLPYVQPLTGIGLVILWGAWEDRAGWFVQVTAAAGGVLAGGLARGMPVGEAGTLAGVHGVQLGVIAALLCPVMSSFEGLKLLRNVAWFGVVGLGVSLLASGVVALFAGDVSGTGVAGASSWLLAACAEWLGIAFVLPLWLLWAAIWRNGLRVGWGNSAADTLRGLGALLLLLAVTVGVFAQRSFPGLFFVFPPLTLVLLFMGMEGATMAVPLVAVVACVGNSLGQGPAWIASGVATETRLLVVQVFLTTVVATAFPVGAMWDERRRSEREVRASQSFTESLIRNSPAAIVVTDLNYRIRTVNRMAERMLWYRAEELIGKATPLMLYDEMEVARRAGRLAEQLGVAISGEQAILFGGPETGVGHTAEWTLMRKGGSPVSAEVTVTTLATEDGRPTGYMLTGQDISDRRRREETLVHGSQEDTLTGLPTRSRLVDRLGILQARSDRYGTRTAALWVQLHDLRQVNAAEGHAVGDRLLVAMAERMRGMLRKMDSVGRVGGDAFVVLVSDLEATGARRVGEKLLRAFLAPFPVGGEKTLTVDASIGIALYPDFRAAGEESRADASTLIGNAELAMLQARDAGRLCFEIYTETMGERVQLQRGLEMALADSMESGEFELHYQPQVSLKDGSLVGLEALLRWNSGTLGSVEPHRFLPLAEQTGLILPLGAWVIRTACRELRMQQGRYGRKLRMAVNLSARQLNQPDLLRIIERALGENGLDAQCLEIEVTEAMLMVDSRQAREFFEGLRRLGVRMAVDDFGTGVSSMASLLRSPVNCLKIDRGFVRDCCTDAKSATVARSIIAMGRQLDAAIVAEGVETVEQMAFLREAGCGWAQGFHFCPPVAATRLAAEVRGMRVQ